MVYKCYFLYVHSFYCHTYTHFAMPYLHSLCYAILTLTLLCHTYTQFAMSYLHSPCYVILTLTYFLQRLINQCMLQSEDVVKSAEAMLNKETAVYSKL